MGADGDVDRLVASRCRDDDGDIERACVRRERRTAAREAADGVTVDLATGCSRQAAIGPGARRDEIDLVCVVIQSASNGGDVVERVDAQRQRAAIVIKVRRGADALLAQLVIEAIHQGRGRDAILAAIDGDGLRAACGGECEGLIPLEEVARGRHSARFEAARENAVAQAADHVGLFDGLERSALAADG